MYKHEQCLLILFTKMHNHNHIESLIDISVGRVAMHHSSCSGCIACMLSTLQAEYNTNELIEDVY